MSEENRKRTRTQSGDGPQSLTMEAVEVLLKHVREEADKRVADADKRVTEMKAEMAQRIAEVKTEAAQRVAEAKADADKAHDRLVDFSTFALNLASKTVIDSKPRLDTVKGALRNTDLLTYGCQGRLTKRESRASFSFSKGTRREVANDLEDSIEKNVSRGVIVKCVTRFRSIADADNLSKRCIDDIGSFWDENKNKYDKVSVKRRRKV